MSTAIARSDACSGYPSMWHAVLSFVRHAGVPAVFGLPDDDMGLLVAAADGPDDQPRVLLCRDQRHAAYMAIGMAQARRPNPTTVRIATHVQLAGAVQRRVHCH